MCTIVHARQPIISRCCLRGRAIVGVPTLPVLLDGLLVGRGARATRAPGRGAGARSGRGARPGRGPAAAARCREPVLLRLLGDGVAAPRVELGEDGLRDVVPLHEPDQGELGGAVGLLK